MIKLTEQSEKNSPGEYDKIFLTREEKGVDPFDEQRWEKLLRFYRGGRLIDLGCLDSRVPLLAKDVDQSAEVWGVDLAPGVVKTMEKRHPDVYWKVCDITKTDFPDEYFGYAVLGEVLEHLDDPQEAVDEAHRILRPGGTLALSVPYNEAREPGAVDKDRHIWSFDKEDVVKLLKGFGRTHVRVLRTKKDEKYQFPILLGYGQKD